MVTSPKAVTRIGHEHGCFEGNEDDDCCEDSEVDGRGRSNGMGIDWVRS